jgi:glycosyltransferase involved in cell wall biosynthesis
MKVLFQSHHDMGRMYGGGPSVILNLAAELRALGVEVVFHDYWKHDPSDFDLIHYFTLYDAFNWHRRAPSDPPLVVTPISWGISFTKLAEERMKHAVRVLRYRTRDRRRLGDPYVIPAHWFPNSGGEAYHLARTLSLPRSSMTIIPHGVARRFTEGDTSLFRETYGLDDYVLCVGRFEHPRKNQLALIQALKDTGLTLVFIGGPEPDHEWFYERCKAEAGPNVHFISPLPHNSPLLVSAYHACKVIVQPALLESPGLTALEGALGGGNVASTANGSTREYFAEYAWYFDPSDTGSIRESVLTAYEAPRSGKMRDRVLERYTWDVIARQQLAAYEQVLRSSSRESQPS